ncbi:MAG: YggS family pyridoxal phosphate-dependent enzyme [Spirochaetaceae bacterium]|jgi:pyridoxal phosphate enzyme (YggS family)|nr:YggS family pyridoxal phosphate-dependent enzyme [Spirochaetaceae bacterium]
MSIKDNVDRITASLAEIALRCGRKPCEITLCAVSKFHPIAAMEEAYAAGVRIFGENRVQEFYPKVRDWDKLRAAGSPDVEIHMIGPLQRNKVKKTLECCSLVQSVDRDELIDELDKTAAAMGKTQGILFEINSGEDAKSGYADKAAFFRGVEKALSSRHLRVEGLMTMAPLTDNEKAVRAAFRGLYTLREEAGTRYPEVQWKILSMGMSGDYPIAIEEGATMVRIGTAIFGERQP